MFGCHEFHPLVRRFAAKCLSQSREFFYQIQVSADLQAWKNYGQIFLDASTNETRYVDADATGSYFRLVSQ
jgi:hypothetical protein